jgi:hypothetical protein
MKLLLMKQHNIHSHNILQLTNIFCQSTVLGVCHRHICFLSASLSNNHLPGMAVYIYNPSIPVAEAGGLQVQVQPGPHVSTLS